MYPAPTDSAGIPYSPSSPPASPHPLILQPANRSATSTPRSPTYGFRQPRHPFDASYASNLSSPPYHTPPGSPPYSPPYVVGRARDSPYDPLPPPPQPFFFQPSASESGFTLQDVVIHGPPTLPYSGNHDSTASFDDVAKDPYPPRATSKLIVTTEGFLEKEEQPKRGALARWSRAGVVFVIFAAIIVGIVVGYKEYKSHESNSASGASSSSLAASSTTDSSTSAPTGSSLLSTTGDSICDGDQLERNIYVLSRYLRRLFHTDR
ncbi:hypothetical protein JCM1841_000930 [Sporobolomyces salmonicolor]